jgi:hypothetical protein
MIAIAGPAIGWSSMARVRRRLGALAGATVAGVGLLVAPALVPAQAAARHGVSAFYTGYAVTRPICAAPTRPGEFTCMAFRRVDVAKGTPGAYRYSIPRASRGPGGGYTPDALAKAYGFNPGSSGSRQTVAIVDWQGDPNVRPDLNHFDRHYGLPAETSTSFRVVNQNGKAGPLPAPDRDASVEIALDVEAVRGVCHKCRIILVEAEHGSSTDLATAENTAARLGATVISNSFGSPERPNHPYPARIVKAFQHPGIVVTASSGDNGYFYWDLRNGDPFDVGGLPHTASFPASLSSTVSVGGTALELNANGTRKSESVWNSDGPADLDGNKQNIALGAAGGCSVTYPAAPWQKSLSGYRAAGCSGKRLSVDVSAIADPQTGYSVYDTYGLNGWAPIGGTSLSSPVIAGMFALAGGAHGMPNPARALYQNRRFRSTSLNDVVAGGNGWCGGVATTDCSQQSSDALGTNNPNWYYGAIVDCSYPARHRVTSAPAKSPECNAVPGYDGPTGVGTPHGLAAFHSTLPTLAISASSPRHPHHRLTFIGHVKRVLTKSSITTRKWTWGDHSAALVSARTVVKHRYAKAGTYTVTLQVSDNFGQHSSSARQIRIK